MENRVKRVFSDLFPINRSLTGLGVHETFDYLLNNFSFHGEIKSVPSGTKVFDWIVPDEWNVNDGYILNGAGEKIVDFKESNLHVMSYSAPVDKIVDTDELRKHIHTLPRYPDRIPYRTSYYNKNWGFCCSHSLLESDQFFPPFKVVIDSSFNSNGNLSWLECVKKGHTEEEILISTYCCHPSLANDNLSGVVLASFLFEYLSKLDTKFTYRLVVLPETIGAISFLSQANTNKIVGGMVLSCVAGPDKLSIKEGFDANHFMNESAHLALLSHVGKEYLTYPFVPDGSDERQYSTPGFRIVTPSIHKSKYYEFDEYHTSADDLHFVKPEALLEALDVHKTWINLIESYCYPKRINAFCEFQLGKRDLYPNLGGTLNQQAHEENKSGRHNRLFKVDDTVAITGAHLDAFHWLMHLADGTISNFEISKKSKLDISVVNEAIARNVSKRFVGVEMKLILFSGDHPRHLFVNKTVLEFFDEVFIVIMEREELLPEPPSDLCDHDKQLFKLHFENRHSVEFSTYGTLNAHEVFKGFNSIFIKPNELNSKLVADKVKEFNADFCFIFGVELILDPVIDVLPKDKINLHLGLSPWYKGGATLFWPFYHLEPQFCGSTFHQITRQADAGEIIHQCVPHLLSGDKIHDVGARCVVKARDDLKKIIMHWKSEQRFKGVVQKTSGRNWRGVDFHASQLRVIYDLYQDKIVDSYLSGALSSRKPKLISCIK